MNVMCLSKKKEEKGFEYLKTLANQHRVDNDLLSMVGGSGSGGMGRTKRQESDREAVVGFRQSIIGASGRWVLGCGNERDEAEVRW